MSSAALLTPVDLPMSEILADPEFNCRGHISPFDVRELIEDIQVRGLKTPITVQPYDKRPPFKYRVLVGHRRFTAMQALNKETIPAVIDRDPLTEAQALVLNLSENVKRKELNPVQEAKALQRLKNMGYGSHKVAEMLAVSVGWTQNRFAILELPEDLQNELVVGSLRMEDVRRIVRDSVTVDDMYNIAKTIKDARIHGKRKIDTTPPEDQKKARTRGEINEIQMIITDVLGFSFATRALAWAQGEISDAEFHADIKEEATKAGKFYSIPWHLRKQG